jgi:dolichol kinase
VQEPLGLKHEVQRKLIHIFTAAIPLALYFGVDETYVFYFVLFLFAGFLTADLLRMNFHLAEKYFFFCIFIPVTRRRAKKTIYRCHVLVPGNGADPVFVL